MKHIFFFLLFAAAQQVQSQGNYVANGSNSATPGTFNTLVGPGAGAAGPLTGNRNVTTSGSRNALLGVDAGRFLTTGSDNVFIGFEAGLNTTTSSANIMIGSGAGRTNTTGSSNTFIGPSAGYSNTTGSNNTFYGYHSGRYNTIGNANAFFGRFSGNSNSTGSGNAFFGASSGVSNNGNYNTYLGAGAGDINQGSNNVFIGFEAGLNEFTASGKFYLSGDATKTLIYGNFYTGQVLMGKPDPIGYVFKGNRTLNVIGGILTDSVRVALIGAWADDVFNNNYKLRPLSEVEAYIKTHQHLPDIPSEKEVKEQGINVADMNKKLLQKVEELTLYIIELEKKLEAQQQQIKELKK